ACIDAYYSVHLPMRVPLVVSIMTMNIQRPLPKLLATTFGTPELVAEAMAMGHRHATLLLPPVDVRANAPGAMDGKATRQPFGIGDGEITLVTVSRLVEMKADSISRTIEAVRLLGREMPLRFLLVGDGSGRRELEHLAHEVNNELKRPAVLFAGADLDPRPAY